MKTLLKSVLNLSLLLTTSCSAIGYRAVTFQPCFPEDREEVSERRSELIKGTFDNFSLSPCEDYQKEILEPNKDYFKINWNFMNF
jgi:hypothetical protein